MTIVYHRPKNELKEIFEIYCFVSSDESGEGVIGHSGIDEYGRDIMMPLVCADKARMESLKPLAKKMAKDAGIKVKLIKLTQREVLEEF